MSKAITETVTQYEALFAARTGLTLMLPCQAAFDDSSKKPSFRVSPDNPRDILIESGDRHVLLKGLQKAHVDASVSQGFIMLYETKDDEVVRCTPCNYQKN